MGRRKQRVRWTSVEEAFFGQANIESEDSAGNPAAHQKQQVMMVVNDETALTQVTKLGRPSNQFIFGVFVKTVQHKL